VLSRPRPPSPAALEQLFGDSQANANGLVQTVEQGIGSVALLGNMFKIGGPALPWETQTDLRRGEAMPLSDYGVLPARAIDCRREGSSDTPHYESGNSGAFTRDNGVWQDGGLLLHFPGESRWVGIFLAFQSQTWHTDDTTGNAVGGVPPAPGVEPATIQILAAMVNPVGPAPERETVLLLNASPEAVDLTGWRMSDRLKHTCLLPAGPLAAGATLQAPAEDGVQFGNQGGAITVLDAEGLKVAGVSYTAAQAKREGWTIVF
jgi:hypothetical protein